MRGLITEREVLANLGLIWREFGPRCLLRVVWGLLSGRPITFLECALKPVPVPSHPAAR